MMSEGGANRYSVDIRTSVDISQYLDIWGQLLSPGPGSRTLICCASVDTRESRDSIRHQYPDTLGHGDIMSWQGWSLIWSHMHAMFGDVVQFSEKVPTRVYTY